MNINAESTPLMRQYSKIKAEHPDSILLYRMGDFYETFDEDAKITAKVLGITLTARANGKAGKVALAGFPWHSLDSYLHKLIKGGYKVAICEQVEDPATAKGIVKREVVEVVTPGSAVSDKMLDEGRNNYIAAITIMENEVGLAWADASTGAFKVCELDLMSLKERLRAIEPSEFLIQNSVEDSRDDFLPQTRGAMISTVEDWVFSYDYGYELLTGHFNTKNLKGYGIESLRLGVQSAGALLHYLDLNHKESLRHFTTISLHSDDLYMGLDQTTVRNLEMFEPLMPGIERGCLIDGLNRTKTAMGSRLLRSWLRNPLSQVDEIDKRLNVIEAFYSGSGNREEVRVLLGNMNDIERLLSRLSSGRAIPRDLYGLRVSLELLPSFLKMLGELN
ncbi:MAG: DNA mismatch repair protein MutS, partial [Bacteroidetes bacterium]|nr:DNA mismatch repair protein MutS [Bacteroidota bacterium]